MKRFYEFVKEYGYLVLMSVCLCCSAVLLWSVSTGQPLAAVAPVHMPVLRAGEMAVDTPAAPEPGQDAAAPQAPAAYRLTEEEIESKLSGFLPESFPVTEVDADIQNGTLELSFNMEREALRQYLKGQGAELGLKREALLRLLPRKLEVDGTFAPAADASGLHLQPLTLELGDKSFDLQGLPQGLFSALDEGMNGLLKAAGAHFTALEFAEDALVLEQR